MLKKEKKNFVKAVQKKYGEGVEFKARDAFSLISDNYYKWFRDVFCLQTNTRCMDYTESGALQIMEELRANGILKKRAERINQWGDEEWYYTLIK